MDQLQASPPRGLRKDVETICAYRVGDDDDHMLVRQRTATFLSRVDPRFAEAAAANPLVQTHAVDIRMYDIAYTRIT